MKSTRAEISLALLIVIGLVTGGGIAWFGPKLWGSSKRAKQSTQATAQLEAATQARIEADRARHASAAAGVATIGRATADLPESPATEFVRAEVPAIMAKLPAPDPLALLEAERRRVAFMEGQRDFARSLYAEESARSSELLKQVAQKDAALKKAQDERERVDLAIEKAASAELAERRQKFVLIGIVGLVAAGWTWSRLNGLSLKNLTMWARQVQDGEDPIAAMDGKLSPRLQKLISDKVAVLQSRARNNT